MKTFDKIKDFLYDGMDYIVMLLIIAAIALVINWRLDGLFTVETTDFGNESSASAEESVVDEFVEEQEKEKAKKENEEDKDEETDNVININIPAGSLPGDIADILVSNNLIEDKSEFLDMVVELQLETKLRSGKYELRENATLEDIIVKLTK